MTTRTRIQLEAFCDIKGCKSTAIRLYEKSRGLDADAFEPFEFSSSDDGAWSKYENRHLCPKCTAKLKGTLAALDRRQDA